MTEISADALIITFVWRLLRTTRTKPITSLPDSPAQLTEVKPQECSAVVRVPEATITTSGSTQRTRTGWRWPTTVAYQSQRREDRRGFAFSFQSPSCITSRSIIEFLITSTETNRTILHIGDRAA